MFVVVVMIGDDILGWIFVEELVGSRRGVTERETRTVATLVKTILGYEVVVRYYYHCDGLCLCSATGDPNLTLQLRQVLCCRMVQ